MKIVSLSISTGVLGIKFQVSGEEYCSMGGRRSAPLLFCSDHFLAMLQIIGLG
jgi:hypothetical protein